MTRTLRIVAAMTAILWAASGAFAQGGIESATRTAELRELSESLFLRDEYDRREARDVAFRAGIPTRRELPGGGVLELQRIAPGIGPVFYITNNVDAADTVSTDALYPGGSAGLNLDGSGMSLAEWDGGAIYAAHPDFAGRLTQVDGAVTVSNHSTHVAGTLIGAGGWLVPDARGMAHAAHLDAYDWNSDTAEMALAAAGGELISNHSYGIAAGWLYIGSVPPDTWWWIGGDQPGDVEDPNFGYYDAESQLWDQIAFDAPYYLIVKASGNDRTDIGPAPGEEYWVIDQDGNFLFTSTLPRNPDCWPAGYDCLPTHSVAKNILTVGAVDDIPGGYAPLAGPSQVQMADFTSWGPSDDGRIKPDVSGNGMFLMSTWGDSPFFAAAAGTSMAAPNVTGSLLLLQQHYENIHGSGNFMRAATLKALAIHAADAAGSADGPDYEFGWGLLNTRAAADVISGDGGGDHQIIEGSLANSATDSIPFNVTQADAILTVTLVWADPPGTPVAPALDPPDLMLVNDLDLRVMRNATTHLPWVLDPAAPAAAAAKGDNFRDNVEQVEVVGTESGSYTIEVRHKGTLLGGLNQDYSLVIGVTPAPPTGSQLMIDEDFSGGLPPGWSVDTVMGIAWTINAPVPGHPRLDNKTGGTGQFAMVDNNYAFQTITSLRTAPLNLSASSAAILRFRSGFNYDTFESINVDASTDGGAGWFNVWQFQGFNPFPTQYVLDISSAIAGEANAMLRFRFDSQGFISGDFWQVDNVELEVFGGALTPGQATNPAPADGATDVDVNINLSWTAGADTDSHDVYFGANPAPGAGEFQGNQPGTAFDPGTLADATTYFWRIDEVNGTGTTTGVVWSFTTATPTPLPGQAANPAPADGATDVDVNVNLAWTAGTDADSHDVYFGTNPAPAGGEFQGNQPGTAFDPGTLADATTYFWRIDEVNGTGTTTGVVWSFTTATPPPLPGQAANPGPADGAVDVDVNADLSWTAGTDTDSHDVYFGTNPSPGPGEFQGNQPGTAFDPGTLADATTFFWRIDEVNGAGTTTGTVWSYTTGSTTQAIHLADLSGVSQPGRRGRWDAIVTVTVVDALGVPVAGALADGDWSNGTTGGGTCASPSDASGQCQVLKQNLKSNVASVDFTVTNLTAAGYSYDSGANEVSGIVTVYRDAPPPLPGPATNPNPENGATGVSVDTILGWTAGTDADSHDVYFGTNPAPGAGEFQGNQGGTSFDPGTLAAATAYFWRVDEVNAQGTTTGVIWSFTTGAPPPLPGQATNPSPTDGATGVSVNASLGWSAGTDATSHDVYFGINPSPGGAEFQGNLPGTGFDPGTLATLTTYYWRIDEVNGAGTTTGAVWSFSTEDSPPSIRTVAATQGKQQGNKIVTVAWNNFLGTNVDIYLNAVLQATVPNAVGSWVDDLGKKPAAGVYTYMVCEQGSLVDCAQDSVSY